MNRLWMIAKNNMKKQKGDMITLFILTLLSAFMLFTAVSVMVGMDKVMDDALVKINGASVFMITGNSKEENAAAKKAFESENAPEYEAVEILSAMPDYKNANASEDEWSSNTFFFTNYEKEQHIQKIEYPKNLSEKDIILPYQMHGRFKIGDTFQLKLEGKVLEFNVSGYAEDPYFSVILNVNVYSCYISDAMYKKMQKEYSAEVSENAMHMGRWDLADFDKDFTTKDLESKITEVYKSEISPYLGEHAEYMNYMACNWHVFRNGAEITPKIVMAIMIMFSIIMLIITVVIISFSIKNFIQRNMKSTGILEAAGYTVKEIRGATVCQTGLVTGVSTLLGLLLGVLGSGAVGNMVSSMLGLTWNRPINVPVLLLTAVFNFGLVLLVTLWISRRYKKITVLDALRGGITNNSFKKNRFSFEKTNLPISGVLSLKETFGNTGRSLVLTLIIFILTLCTTMGFGMWEKFGSDKYQMIDIFSFEMSTIAVAADTDIGDVLRDVEGVKNVVGFVGFEPTVSAGDKQQTIYTYAYDSNHNRQYVNVIEGRLPEHDNEIMITSGVSDDLNVGVGDMITLTYGSRSADYLITGIDQKMERMGRVLSLNYEGADKIVPGRQYITYYVDGAEGEEYESLKAKLEALRSDKYPDSDWTYADMDKITTESVVVIMAAMKAVCIVLLVVTVLIVIFVESLVIRSRVVKEWKNLGVLRAIGMTNKELISQIMFSNLPAVLFGSVVAVLFANLVGSNVIRLLLTIFGFRKVNFAISSVWLVTTVVVIVFVAVLSAGISGRRVKHIEPALLITEE